MAAMSSPIPTEILTAPTNPSVGEYFEAAPVKPVLLPQGNWSLSSVVAACNNATLPEGPFSPAKLAYDKTLTDDWLVPFFLLPLANPVTSGSTLPIGFLRREVVQAVRSDNDAMERIKCAKCWRFYGESGDPWAVSFEAWFTEAETVQELRDTRSEHIDRMVRSWKEAGKFPDLLSGWRDERYTIYGPYEPPPATKSPTSDPLPSPLPGGNVAFLCERAATPLFSFATYGVHMTGYTLNPLTKEYSFWVPRRSKTKQTFPYMLDNTVAGGIAEYDSPLESMIRECEEEASLDADFVKHRLRSSGIVCYVYRKSDGYYYPEVEYTYDLLFPPNDPHIPTPNDSEVDSFQLYSTQEVLDLMIAGEFKPNCALILIDFFIRHGLLGYENDTAFVDICQQLRTRFPLPGPR